MVVFVQAVRKLGLKSLYTLCRLRMKQDNWQLAKMGKLLFFDISGQNALWGKFLNFGLLSHISLTSALRGLETSPNIFKWGELLFPTLLVALKRKSNFDPLSRLYDLLKLHNLYQSIALQLLKNLRTILIWLSQTVLKIWPFEILAVVWKLPGNSSSMKV